MPLRPYRRGPTGPGFLGTVLLAASLAISACKPAPKTDTAALDQAGMWFNSITELKTLNVSNAEISELAIARQAGLTDDNCVELIKLARSRHLPFADGQSISDLLAAGISEQSALELARLNQLGLWSGEARVLHLAGISDQVIVAVAQRRSQSLPVLSGNTLADLKNANVSDAMILDMVQKGITEDQASYYIAQRQRAGGGHGFVYQGRSRKR